MSTLHPKSSVLPLSYSYATRKSYTRISPLHGKKDYWLFQGVHKLPHLYLTWIRRKLFTTASITPSTHMLPLSAITTAQHRRFGGSPLFTTLVAHYSTADYPQVSLFRCPDLFNASQHVGLTHLH